MSPTAPASTRSTPQAQYDQFLALIGSQDPLGAVAENIGKVGRDYNNTQFTDELKKRWDSAQTNTTVKNAGEKSASFIDELVTDVIGWGKKQWDWLTGGTKALESATKTTSQVATTVEATKDAATVGGITEGAASIGGKFLNVAGIAYGAYDLIKNFGQMTLEHGAISGAAVGAGIGSLFPGIGTVVGGVVGGLVGGVMSLFRKSGKHKDQKARDTMRKALVEAGVIDSKFTIGLANGSRYDIGIDGGPKAQFGGRRPFEIDLKDPFAVKISTFATPLARIVTGGDEKLTSDLSGYLANAAMSNAGGDEMKARENMKAIYEQFKLQPEEIIKGVAGLVQNGQIKANLGAGYVSVLKDLFADSKTARK